jgi:hypothetical protein
LAPPDGGLSRQRKRHSRRSVWYWGQTELLRKCAVVADTPEEPAAALEAPQADLADLRRRVQEHIGDEALTSWAKRAKIGYPTLKSFLAGGRIYPPTAVKMEAVLRG